MGNKGSSHSIFVTTDKGYYMAGETVTGHIFLDFQKQFPGQEVILKVTGREENEFEQLVREESGRHHHHRAREKNRKFKTKKVFFQHRIVLYSWPQGFMPPGQYSFPFQFLLSPNLSGSFTEKTSKYSAEILYKIKGECPSLNEKSVKKLKHSQPLVIREPQRNQMHGIYKEVVFQPIAYCCFRRGESHISSHLPNNVYQPGEAIRIEVDIDNKHCKVAIKDVRAELRRELLLVSANGQRELFTQKITEKRLGHVHAKAHAQKLSEEIILRHKGKRDGDVLQPSTNGLVVKCNYSIVVTAQSGGCTCSSTPARIELPIMLVSPPPPNYGVVDKPQNWQPTEFAVREIQFNQQDMYRSQKDLVFEQGDDAQYVPPDLVQQQQQQQEVAVMMYASQNGAATDSSSLYAQMGQPPYMRAMKPSCYSENFSVD